MIPPDDIMEAYMKADLTKKEAISDLLREDLDDFVCATFDHNSKVYISLHCCPLTSHGLVHQLIRGLTKSFGDVWRDGLFRSLM